jgi:hypothetical protein
MARYLRFFQQKTTIMKNLASLFVLLLIIVSGCKKDENNSCDFRNSSEFLEPEYPLTCDTCYFSYDLMEKQYYYQSTTLGMAESVKCLQNPDTCSHVTNPILSPESFAFTMQRLGKQDSLKFIQSVGKSLPLRPVDSIYWGQRMLSASFELTDKCNTTYVADGYFTINSILFLGTNKVNDDLDIHVYHITGLLEAEINRNNQNETVSGKFSFNRNLVIFKEN